MEQLLPGLSKTNSVIRANLMRLLEGGREGGCPALLLTPDFRELVVKSLTEIQRVSYMTPRARIFTLAPASPQILPPPWKKNFWLRRCDTADKYIAIAKLC